MARRVEKMKKGTDDIFKKQIQCANDKRDENDENIVVVKVNDYQYEMTQNLNSYLSDHFMERSMTKIMNDIISNVKKDEAEKNEN